MSGLSGLRDFLCCILHISQYFLFWEILKNIGGKQKIDIIKEEVDEYTIMMKLSLYILLC